MKHMNLSGDFVFNEKIFNYAMFFSQTVGSAINWLTLLVIYSYRGSEMRSYRWHLFFYQLASTLLDFGMDSMAQPVFFFPHMAGTANGWLRTVFGMPTFTVYGTMMTFGGLCLHFICFSPLYYRWQLLLSDSSWMKFKTEKNKFGFQLFCILGSPTIYLAIDMCYEQVDMVKFDFAQHNPEDAFLTQVDGFYVINTWKNKIVLYSNLYLVSWLGFLLVMVVMMSVGCATSLNGSRRHMSKKTRQMHLRFLKNIFFQSSVPMLLLEFPVSYWFVSIFFDVRFPGHQNVTNLTIFSTCIHGAFGSLIVFYLNPSYRAFIAIKLHNLIFCCWAVKQPIDPNTLAMISQPSTSGTSARERA